MPVVLATQPVVLRYGSHSKLIQSVLYQTQKNPGMGKTIRDLWVWLCLIKVITIWQKVNTFFKWLKLKGTETEQNAKRDLQSTGTGTKLRTRSAENTSHVLRKWLHGSQSQGRAKHTENHSQEAGLALIKIWPDMPGWALKLLWVSNCYVPATSFFGIEVSTMIISFCHPVRFEIWAKKKKTTNQNLQPFEDLQFFLYTCRPLQTSSLLTG